jgi:hypothetical protein
MTKSANAGELPGTNASQPALGGCLIINADDWGRDARTTDNPRAFPHGAFLGQRYGFHAAFRPRCEYCHREGVDIGLT